MNASAIIEAIKISHPKLYRRLQIIAQQRKVPVVDAVIFCLKGETTQSEENDIAAKNAPFLCPKGETTHAKKGGVK